MARGLKKFIYGLFYLLLIAFIIYLAGFNFKEETEEGNEENNYLAVEITQSPVFFQLDSGETAFLTQLKNPNTDVKTSFSYKLIIWGENEKLLGEIRGTESLLPETKEFVFDFNFFEDSVNSIDIEILDEIYESASVLLKEDIKIKEVATNIEEKRVKITGVLENKSVLSLYKIKLICILVDKFGFNLYVGGTILKNLNSFGEKEFEIFIPIDNEIKKEVVATSTQIYINLE